MKITLFGITFASAQNIILFPALIGILALVWWCFTSRKKIITALAAPQWQSHLVLNYNSSKQFAKFGLLMIGFISLFLAFLQPQWDKKEEPVAQEGRDLFIALDISKSMLAQDVFPNRLTLAKSKIATLLTQLGSERVGLLLFSGSSVVQCPLTSDFGAFMMFLNQIDHSTMSSGTTALDSAIQKVVDIFKTTPNRNNKVLVVFTDGEDFSSNLSAIKQEAQKMGLRIITVGVGTSEGAPIPLLDDNGNKAGYQNDEKGTVVISKLNEGILSSLASSLGGLYVHATTDSQDLKKIVTYVERMEKERFDDKKIQSLQEQYHYCIAMSLICFILEWLL